MDAIFKELLTQGGPLGVLVVVVWIFVRDRHTSSIEHRAWMEQMLKSSQDTFKSMHADHLTARQETRECLRENTRAMIQNTDAMQKLSTLVNGKIPTHTA